MQATERYHEAIRYLEGLLNIPSKNIFEQGSRDPSVYIKRTAYFLKLIGASEQDIKFIHITGTAGKGSVTNTLHEILSAAGKQTGSFTSPFTTTQIEQIKVDEKYISPAEFADLVEYIKPYIDKACVEGPYGMPSYFEIMFAIALLYFQKQKCEWVVLEVGLGGRYDATNVITSPVVTAITNIDYDHTELLGKTLAKIAFDKAGIIKRGSTFFTAEQKRPLIAIFQSACNSKKVPMHRVPQQKTSQAYNEALAMMIAKHLGISDQPITRGIKNARLPCRFEIMQNQPMVILDGAHNRAKIRSTVERLSGLHFEKLHLVIGMAQNKTKAHIMREILPVADHVYITRFQTKGRTCADPKELLALSKKYITGQKAAALYIDPRQALESALLRAGKNDVVLVVGSFFLAGELRTRWYPEKRLLQKRSSF